MTNPGGRAVDAEVAPLHEQMRSTVADIGCELKMTRPLQHLFERPKPAFFD